MRHYSDDPVRDFARHDHEQEEWLKSRPECACCGRPIQDERLMKINDEYYHIDCAIEVFGEYTDEII